MGILEDWKNRKLQELIDAGINPFIELDLDSLPVDGSSYAGLFNTRKIYGNLIDGIPFADIKLKSDGTLNYKVDTDDTLFANQQTISNNIIDIEEYQLQHQIARDGSGYNLISYGIPPTTVGITNVNFVLAAGAAANQVLLAPGAGLSWYVFWIEISTSLAGAAGGQNYHVGVVEETSGDNYADFYVHSFNMPYRFVLCNDSGGATSASATADDQDLLMNIDGGNAAENIFCRICFANY